jgi:hypothetical protein
MDWTELSAGHLIPFALMFSPNQQIYTNIFG